MSGEIVMLNPVAKVHAEEPRAPLPIDGVRGRRLGFLFNGHVSSVAFWHELERRLAHEYGPSEVVSIRKDNTFAPAPLQQVAEVAAGSQLAFTGLGAWGSCTSGSVWDAVRLEKRGVPSILLVHHIFEAPAKAQAQALGIPDLRYIVYPQPRPEQTPEEARADAARVAAELQRAIAEGIGRVP